MRKLAILMLAAGISFAATEPPPGARPQVRRSRNPLALLRRVASIEPALAVRLSSWGIRDTPAEPRAAKRSEKRRRNPQPPAAAAE